MSELKLLVGIDIDPSMKRIKLDLDSIKTKLDGQLKLSIGIDSKAIEKQLADLKTTISKADVIKLDGFTGVNVSAKEISAVTAEKLKQALAIKEADAAEKLRGQTEQNNAKIEIQNSKLRIQLEKEKAQASKQAETEAKKSAQNQDSVQKINEQVDILRSRIEVAKVSWSKMFGDPNVIAQIKNIESALADVGGDPKKYAEVNRQWQLLSNNIKQAELNQKSFGSRVTNTDKNVKSPARRAICA